MEPLPTLPETVEPRSGMDRRDFLIKAAAAGTIAWAAPVILSQPAWAVEGGGGTPKCRPTIALQCQRHECGQDNQVGEFHGMHSDLASFLPAILVTVSNCPCANPVKRPSTCIKIDNLNASCLTPTNSLVAYGNGAVCFDTGTPPGGAILSGGTWKCFNPTNQVFFGPPRATSGTTAGAIPPLPNGTCTITFRLGVWAGLCPDRANPTEAYNCQTYDFTIVWNQPTQDTPTITSCSFPLAAAANSFCTSGNTRPCTGTC